MKKEELRFIIDEGNSLVKIAAYRGDEWLFFDQNRHLDEEFLSSCLQNVVQSLPAEKPKAIFLSVRKDDVEKEIFLSKYFDILFFSGQTPVPVYNRYETPDTLGLDRLAAVVGAAFLFKGSDILVIDAGTCITYDFIDAQKNYLGGGIMPGFQMKLQALHNFTEKLPLLSLAITSDLCGLNTRDAILAGTVNVTMLSLDAVIHNFRQKFPRLKTILCGGNAKLLQDNLKNNTFAEPKLVLYGLKQILDFNED